VKQTDVRWSYDIPAHRFIPARLVAAGVARVNTPECPPVLVPQREMTVDVDGKFSDDGKREEAEDTRRPAGGSDTSVQATFDEARDTAVR